MKLGITTYTYRWAVGGDPRFRDDFKIARPLSVFDLVDKTSKLGLEVLQICENIDFEMGIHEYKRLREVANHKGITLELGTAGLEFPILRKNAQIAELTGSHLLRVYPEEREPVDSIIERIRSFLPALRERELTLAIENSSLCVYSSLELLEILRGVNDPLVGACVDTVNSVGLLERPLETVEVLSPYAVSLHLKDFRIQRRSVGGFTVFGAPLGRGMIDVKAVLNLIKKCNRDPNILLEQWMDRRESEEETLAEEERWVKEGIRILRSVLQHL